MILSSLSFALACLCLCLNAWIAQHSQDLWSEPCLQVHRGKSWTYKFHSPPAPPVLRLPSQINWVITSMVYKFSHGASNSSASHTTEENITSGSLLSFLHFLKPVSVEHQSYLLKPSTTELSLNLHCAINSTQTEVDVFIF